MPEIYVPFTQGQSEAVDPKLLPQGLFLGAQNVRYQKDARLGVRAAYRSTDMSKTPIGAGTYDVKRDLFVKYPATAGNPPQAYSNDFNATQNLIGGTAAGGATFPTYHEIPSGPSSPARLMTSQQLVLNSREVAAITSLYVSDTQYYVAYDVIDTVSKLGVNADPISGRYIVLTQVNPLTGVIMQTATIPGGSLENSNVKMVLINGLICIFYAVSSADQVRMTSFDTTTSMTRITDNALVVTAFTGKSPYFDISPGGASTEAYLMYQSATDTNTFGTVSSTGVFAALTGGTWGSSGPDFRFSLTPTGLAPTDQIAMIVVEGTGLTGGTVSYGVYRRSTNSFVIAPTVWYGVSPFDQPVGYPVISSHSTLDWIAGYNTQASAGKLPSAVVFSKPGVAYAAAQNNVVGHYIVSKPFQLGTFAGVFTTEVDAYGTASGSYYMTNCNYGNQEPQCVVEFCQLAAQPTESTVLRRDPRQIVPVGATALSSAPGSLAALVPLPVKTTNSNGWRVYRFEYGALEDAFASVKLNSDLHFAGGRITTYDGDIITEAGFSLPNLPTLTAGAGTIPAGTYQVVVIWEWFDAKGRRHKSAPSLPATITLGGPGSITVAGDRPRATNKNISQFPGTRVRVRVYRTSLAQPAIFTDATGTPSLIDAVTGYSVSCTASDATIISNEALYTQGVQGGLSGLLQNDRPPGAKYIWAGSDRLIIGGVENPSEVWFSKLRTEGEPMQWTNFAAYKAQVDGVVTAVAEMDGTWFVGTNNAWWRITGAGPQDNGSNGSFDPPSKLPNNIGCISHKSIVLTGSGLMFQGPTNRMYLMPRGGGDPQEIGLQVRDTLNSFPYITAAAFNQKANIAYWACCNTTGTAGRLLAYDVRLKQWTVDNWLGRVIRTLAVNNGLLRIDGQAIETAGNYQDTDGITPTTVLPLLTMGDFRPFGMSGHGRVRRANILGEARDVTTAFSVTLEVSYDSGKTYTDVGTFPAQGTPPIGWANGLAIGDSIELDHMLQYPKGDNYRMRLSWSTPSATEGIIFNGISFETYPEPGLNRLGPSARA